MTKTCKDCKLDKPIEEFPLQDTKKGVLRAQCKICYRKSRREKYKNNEKGFRDKHNQRAKDYYKANPEKVKEHSRKWAKANPEKRAKTTKKIAQRYGQEVIDYKVSKGCANCPEKHPACLEFHHLDPSKKEYNISGYRRRGGLKYIQKEIDKCIVLCSNCHRKLHYELNKNQENVHN